MVKGGCAVLELVQVRLCVVEQVHLRIHERHACACQARPSVCVIRRVEA